MEIPIPTTKESDIYSYGFDKNLNKISSPNTNFNDEFLGSYNTQPLILEKNTAGGIENIFSVIPSGENDGDVKIGNYDNEQGILYDKSTNTTTFKGLVTLGSLDYDRFVFSTMFESLDAWSVTNTGSRGSAVLEGPCVHFYSGNQVNDVISLQLTPTGITGDSNKDPYFSAVVYWASITSHNVYAWVLTDTSNGETPNYGFGFQFNPTDDKLYAVYGNGSSYQKKDTGVTDFNQFLGLKAFYRHTTDILKFYVNNVLIWEISNPDLTIGNDPLISFGEKSKDAAYGHDLYIYNATYTRLY